MKPAKASLGMRFLASFLDGIILNLGCSLLAPFGIYYVGSLVVQLLYFGLMEGCTGSTLGKKICGLTVVSANGRSIDMGTGFLRALGRILSGLILGIGFLFAFFREDGCAMHDLMAGTVVVPAKASSAASSRPAGSYYGSPRIVGLSGPFAGSSFSVPERGLIIGRDGAICSVVYPQNTPGISGTHCKITYNASTGMFLLQDLDSSYGTYLQNGTRVSHQPIALDSGAQFYLASQKHLFRVIVD